MILMPVSFYIMVAVGFMMVANGIIRQNRLWEAPTWVGFIFVSFMVPQAIHIETTGTGEEIGSWFSWYYITGCLTAFWWAFGASKRRAAGSVLRLRDQMLDNQLAARAAVVLILGAVALTKIREVTAVEEYFGHVQWSGTIALFYLIFQCIFMALAIAMVRWLATGKKIWAIFGSIALALAVVAIAANAKRSLTAEIVFIIGSSLFFARAWVPPRAVIVTAMIFGTVIVHQVGPIRDYVRAGYGNAFDAVVAGVPFESFAYFNPGKAPELTQGVVDIHRANETGQIVGPALLWNKMVQQYVPAFLVGADIKDSLKVDRSAFYEDEFHIFDWRGATRTGFSDSYVSYSVFGVLVFALIGSIMGKLYVKARNGVPWALFLYPLLINDSMFAVTESTTRFFSGGLFVVFVTIFLFWRSTARVRHRPTFPADSFTAYSSQSQSLT